MSLFEFCGFMDYEDGKMARVTTMGEYEIPFNIFIDNASELEDVRARLCSIDVYGIGSDLSFFATEEEYRASGTRLAPEAMIPIGTFSLNEDDEDFKQSPHILFTGKVIDVDRDSCPGPDGPNCLILIETVGMIMQVYAECDEEIEKDYLVHGVAWLFGNLKPEDEE